MINNLGNFKKEFEIELNDFFSKKLKSAKKDDELSYEMIDLIKQFSLNGGKRIRPALLFYGYKCFSNNENKEILKASICVELVQSFLLIHDDIIDNDDFRRNAPTVHKSYEIKYGKTYGKSLAILAGDLSYNLAIEALLNISFDEKKKILALNELNNSVQKVIYGQELDILSTINNYNESDLLKIHNLKTAKYTFEGPLVIGAILAGANESDIKILKEYSINMGIAFQLQDDILGIFANEKILGKPIGSDLKEGKKTLLILKAEENSCQLDKKFINSLLGKKDISFSEVKQIRDIIEESGSLNYSKKMIVRFILDAKKIIEKSNFKKEGKDFLIELTDYLIKREN